MKQPPRRRIYHNIIIERRDPNHVPQPYVVKTKLEQPREDEKKPQYVVE